jgi:hypothetical protein
MHAAAGKLNNVVLGSFIGVEGRVDLGHKCGGALWPETKFTALTTAKRKDSNQLRGSLIEGEWFFNSNLFFSGGLLGHGFLGHGLGRLSIYRSLDLGGLGATRSIVLIFLHDALSLGRLGLWFVVRLAIDDFS